MCGAVQVKATNIDGVNLGSFTLVGPAGIFACPANEENTEQAVVGPEWSRALLGIAVDAPIHLQAIIARQKADVAMLAKLEAGDVISLRCAALDAVDLVAEQSADKHVLAAGAVRALDGLRALRISSVAI